MVWNGFNCIAANLFCLDCFFVYNRLCEVSLLLLPVRSIARRFLFLKGNPTLQHDSIPRAYHQSDLMFYTCNGDETDFQIDQVCRSGNKHSSWEKQSQYNSNHKSYSRHSRIFCLADYSFFKQERAIGSQNDDSLLLHWGNGWLIFVSDDVVHLRQR